MVFWNNFPANTNSTYKVLLTLSMNNSSEEACLYQYLFETLYKSYKTRRLQVKT